jgi:hypothetical protein
MEHENAIIAQIDRQKKTAKDATRHSLAAADTRTERMMIPVGSALAFVLVHSLVYSADVLHPTLCPVCGS